MSGILAKFFRWNNSRLIVSDNIVSEKLLKFFLYLSLVVYRNAKPKKVTHAATVTIENFDSDIILKVDRSRAMGSALYWTGFHEFREFVFLHRFLKHDMVFVDVGANMGEYTLFAAKRLSKGKVLAFEPLPSIREVFIENIRLNGFRNIEVYPFGLSAQEEILEIHEFEDVHEGLATLYPGNRRSKSSTTVQLKKFDDVASEARVGRIDFIKIDIEGGELKAIRGCARVVEQYRPVFMIEINAETYKTAGYRPGDVMAVFSRWNYLPHQIKKRGLLERCTALPDFGNVLFIPQ